MRAGRHDGRKRLYLDFDGYFAAVEEQAAPADLASSLPERFPCQPAALALYTGVYTAPLRLRFPRWNLTGFGRNVPSTDCPGWWSNPGSAPAHRSGTADRWTGRPLATASMRLTTRLV